MKTSASPSRTHRFIFILPVLLLTACSSVLPLVNPASTDVPQQTLQPISTLTQTSQETPEPIRVAEITFRVTIPEDTPADGPIQLSILDEVTGLALNTRQHIMQAETERIYSVTIQLPADAMIKYRYTRGSEIPAAEHISDGRPVRYRLFYTRESGSIHDIISRWNDTPFNAPTGRIFGTITDSQTGAPIPDLLVTAGGQQTVTRSDGSYLITALPSGTHNLVTYAKDAAYTIFQQGAVIATNAATPASFALTPRPLQKVTFQVRVPEGTIPGVPLYIAGNVYQLGNVFADLAGGISTPAHRLPMMAYDPDTQVYSHTLDLPAGAYIRYKYTLGDGFWNAETLTEGALNIRQMIVPASDTIVNDQVAYWASAGDFGAVWFAVKTPGDTPSADTIWLQLRSWGWTEPLPMWRVGANEWVYLLSSPLYLSDQIDYRFCRNAQCDNAREDIETPRSFQPGASFQAFEDEIVRWTSFAPWDHSTEPVPQVDVVPRDSGFLTGFALADDYQPSWLSFAGRMFNAAKSNGANTVFLTPTWSFTQAAPPVFEPVAGSDMSWLDVQAFAAAGSERGMDVALYPRPRFETSASEWWDNAPRDYAWWNNWFEQYDYFLDHHAALAAEINAGTLVIGGSWVNPAIPNGYLADGFTSGVPAEAAGYWQEMINDVRAGYSGRLAWSLNFPQGVNNPPPFLDQMDEIYITWELPLTKSSEAGLHEMAAAAGKGLDNTLLPFYLRFNKPIIVEIRFPSAVDGASGCVNGEGGACLPLGSRDLEEQILAYEAVLQAVNARDWIAGVVSADYLPPLELKDRNFSVRGKPAEILLRNWFTGWLP